MITKQTYMFTTRKALISKGLQSQYLISMRAPCGANKHILPYNLKAINNQSLNFPHMDI